MVLFGDTPCMGDDQEHKLGASFEVCRVPEHTTKARIRMAKDLGGGGLEPEALSQKPAPVLRYSEVVTESVDILRVDTCYNVD